MLNVKEASAILGISQRFLYDLVNRGQIQHYRIAKSVIRFEGADILEYKESCKVTKRAPQVTQELQVIREKCSIPGGKSVLEEYFREWRKSKKQKT